MCVGITIKKLTKKIHNTVIVDSLNLRIKPGSIVSIFGPNGAGKTTLLNMLAGIDSNHEGDILFDSVHKIQVSYVMQNYRESLLNWRTCRDNIRFPLEFKEGEVPTQWIDEIEKMLDQKVNLDTYPYECSGGQQQLISFARALITKPNLILIDEPFSALDYENNLFLRKCLIEYYHKYRPTIVFITHSVEEAIHLSHDIVVLTKKPTQVHTVIENSAQHPRGIEYVASPYFDRLKKKLLLSFVEVTGI